MLCVRTSARGTGNMTKRSDWRRAQRPARRLRRAGLPDVCPNTAPKPGPGVFFVATNGNDSMVRSSACAEPRAGRTARSRRFPRAQGRSRLQSQQGARRTHDRRAFTSALAHISRGPDGADAGGFRPGARCLSGRGPVLKRRAADHRLEGGHRSRARSCGPPNFPMCATAMVFRELWVNGQRATRARHPNKGYLPIAELPTRRPIGRRARPASASAKAI